MKKTLSILLALVMLLTLGIPTFAADKKGTDVPNVYLQGQGSHIVAKDGKTEIYDGASMPEGFLSEAISSCMPLFVTAVKEDTDEAWAALREKQLELMLPVYGGFVLDKNGEASDGSYCPDNDYNAYPVRYGNGDSSYRIRSFNYFQDWRIDPFENAKLLDKVIQNAKAKTNQQKVNLIGRCEGANVILAYLAEYGYDDVNCVELYVQSASGTDVVSALFSGRMQFDSTALRRFKAKSDKLSIEDQTINAVLDAALEMTGDTMLLDAGLVGLQALAPKIYEKDIVYLLRATYGTMPGIWSIVGADYYQDAKKGVFKGCEDEYAGLIAKLDDYDARVRQRVDEIILNGIAAGVKFANFNKYGDFQLPPLCETNNEINDNTICLKNESLGATTARIGATLSKDYLAKAEKNGTAKYISPDKMVDASTCLLPDTSWFIYGSNHVDFPEIIHNFMLKFLKANDDPNDPNCKMTVFSDPTAPQYMRYEGEEDNGDTLVPMSEDNAETLESGDIVFKNVNWKDMFQRFFKTLIAFLKQYLPNLLKK